MFTGLIEQMGTITAVTPITGGTELSIQSVLSGELTIGESIAVSGVCLTVVATTHQDFVTSLSVETLQRSTFGGATVGTIVNLERALLPTTRLGGHFVSGHVDAVGVIHEVVPCGEFVQVRLDCPVEFQPFIVSKGSIAVDGISLTVNAEQKHSVEIMIIPHTRQQTTAAQWKAGVLVNLEFDLIAKQLYKLSQPYVTRFQEVLPAHNTGTTKEKT